MRHGVGVFVVALLVGVAACGGDEVAVRSSETAGDSSVRSSAAEPLTSVLDDDSDDRSALTLRLGAVTERSVDGGADGRSTTAAIVGMGVALRVGNTSGRVCVSARTASSCPLILPSSGAGGKLFASVSSRLQMAINNIAEAIGS